MRVVLGAILSAVMFVLTSQSAEDVANPAPVACPDNNDCLPFWQARLRTPFRSTKSLVTAGQSGPKLMLPQAQVRYAYQDDPRVSSQAQGPPQTGDRTR
jgi:hypothetical protein